MTSDPVTLLSPNLLKGHTALVTGGGSGINLAIAKGLARAGADVAICGRNEEKLRLAVDELSEIGCRSAYAVADVRDDQALTAAFARVAEQLGSITTVIAGAAGNFFATAEALSPKGFRTVVDIDLLGSFHTARAALPYLKQTRGSLLFVSAGQAYLPLAMQAHVGAAKAGIENLMRNLALEWGRHGIRANTIVPGPIAETEGMRRLAGPTGLAAWTDSIPLARFGELEEIAAMAVVLTSPLAAYVTGAQVVVDGGLSLSGFGTISRAVEGAFGVASE